MTATNAPNYDLYRIRLSDGEPYRRYYIYITQSAGKVERIELCDPNDITDRPQTRETCHLLGYLDVFRDHTCVLTFNYERDDFALIDFACEYKTLMMLDPSRDDGCFYFTDPQEETRFYLACGAGLV